MNRRTRKPAPTTGEDPAELMLKAYTLVTDMENALLDASSLAYGVSIIAADSIPDDKSLGGFLMRVGNMIGDLCEEVEEKRVELFRLLHPGRAKFEAEGWPGDRAATP